MPINATVHYCTTDGEVAHQTMEVDDAGFDDSITVDGHRFELTAIHYEYQLVVPVPVPVG